MQTNQFIDDQNWGKCRQIYIAQKQSIGMSCSRCRVSLKDQKIQLLICIYWLMVLSCYKVASCITNEEETNHTEGAG